MMAEGLQGVLHNLAKIQQTLTHTQGLLCVLVRR